MTHFFCDHCKKNGSECCNMKWGRFCVASTFRYYLQNKDNFSPKMAIYKFKEAYMYASDVSLYNYNESISRTGNVDEVELPGCVEARSLVFALNLIEWEEMVRDVHLAAGYYY